MAFDYKKEYKEFYLPGKSPQIVEIPAMNFIAVRGTGDPNDEDGDYKAAISLLYGLAFTIKMSRKAATKSRGILIMWFRHWKDSGGRTVRKALIIAGRKHSSGFP